MRDATIDGHTRATSALREAIVRGDIAPEARLDRVGRSATNVRDVARRRAHGTHPSGAGRTRRSRATSWSARAAASRTTRRSRSCRSVPFSRASRSDQTAERIDDAGAVRLRALPRAPPRATRAAATSSARRTRTPTCTQHCSSSPATERPSDSSALELPDGALPVPHDPDPGTPSCIGGRARGHRGGSQRSRRDRGRGRDARPPLQRRRGGQARSAAGRHRQGRAAVSSERGGAQREHIGASKTCW